MVERWTCKYCNVTINDDAPSRAAHEGGLRHKSAVERALRQTYKKAERDRREAAVQARELAKVERAAERAEAGKAGEGEGEGPSSGTGAGAGKRKRAGEDGPSGGGAEKGTVEWKPKDKFAAYTTAANLGIGEDPEVVRAREEQELRQREGFASEWTVVVDGEGGASASASQPAPLASRAPAPAPPAPAAADNDDDDLRSFKTKEKKAPQIDLEDEDGASAAPLEFKKRTKKRRT